MNFAIVILIIFISSIEFSSANGYVYTPPEIPFPTPTSRSEECKRHVQCPNITCPAIPPCPSFPSSQSVSITSMPDLKSICPPVSCPELKVESLKINSLNFTCPSCEVRCPNVDIPKCDFKCPEPAPLRCKLSCPDVIIPKCPVLTCPPPPAPAAVQVECKCKCEACSSTEAATHSTFEGPKYLPPVTPPPAILPPSK